MLWATPDTSKQQNRVWSSECIKTVLTDTCLLQYSHAVVECSIREPRPSWYCYIGRQSEHGTPPTRVAPPPGGRPATRRGAWTGGVSRAALG
jgi:hypothetical protein